MRVKFTKSPTGKFNLAYFEGDEAEVPELLGEMIISEGYGVLISQPETIETTTEKAVVETPEGNKRGRKKAE